MAFDSLKRALCEAPVLQIPEFNRDFVLVTDDSDLSVSAVLHQEVNSVLVPIAYYSRVLAAEERNVLYELVCLAVIFGCEKCRHYTEVNSSNHIVTTLRYVG